MRSAFRAAVVGLALVATVLVPCLCAAMPASSATDHGCCAGEEGIGPVPPSCCACAVTPISDFASPAAAHHFLHATTLSSGPRTGLAAAPAIAPVFPEHIAPPPLLLRV